MARKGPEVLLGFEDESITDKNKSLVNFTTNKIGGRPDWPVDGIPHPSCRLCGLSLPLVVQVYAPLAISPYHRTLYIFGCINPNCWNQNESWVCIRSQALETGSNTANSAVNALTTSEWCTDAGNWDDDNNGNDSEENGNVFARIETYCSDEEDEMEDSEDDIRVQFGKLNVDERNANWEGGGVVTAGAGAGAGAVGRLHSPSATAEIEGDESEVVSIDTPTAPQHDLIALLEEVSPLPMEVCSSNVTDADSEPYVLPIRHQFASSFISVGEEALLSSPTITPISEHVRELLQVYQQNSDDGVNINPEQERCMAQDQEEQFTQEEYERSVPTHGNLMFHQFVSQIQKHPGQILRYNTEGGYPLLLYPAQNVPVTCAHCHNKMVFELQVLPTLIHKLHLLGSGGEGVHLEFGTVLVFACQNSCWTTTDTWREERVVVQAEPT